MFNEKRLLFAYLFVDLDKWDVDAGIELDRIAMSESDGKVICDCRLIHPKGVKKTRFSVDSNTRRIEGMRNRSVCYWVPPRATPVQIYDREYFLLNGSYYHHSERAYSRLSFDEQGFETSALNISFEPRRYIERYIRLADF